MKLGLVIAASCAAILFLAWSAQADVAVRGDVHISFGEDEQRIIKDYYGREIIVKAEKAAKGKGKGKKHKGLPPGLAKKNKLPPGIQMQLERGAILSADLQREIQPLPRELEIRLRPLPSPNHVRVTVGTDILIMDKETRKILDVMRDVALLAHDLSK